MKVVHTWKINRIRDAGTGVVLVVEPDVVAVVLVVQLKDHAGSVGRRDSGVDAESALQICDSRIVGAVDGHIHPHTGGRHLLCHPIRRIDPVYCSQICIIFIVCYYIVEVLHQLTDQNSTQQTPHFHCPGCHLPPEIRCAGQILHHSRCHPCRLCEIVRHLIITF